MSEKIEALKNKNITKTLIVAYPFVVLIASFFINLLVFGVNPIVVSLPTPVCIYAVVISAVLLVINHTWLMTTTELTRLRYDMHATPEEWVSSGASPQDVSEEGSRELERRHNAHRNTTENAVHFVFLAVAFAFCSPTAMAAQVWIIGFALARLGYTYSYLSGSDGLRGLFMSLGLLAMYGLASYLLIGLVV